MNAAVRKSTVMVKAIKSDAALARFAETSDIASFATQHKEAGWFERSSKPSR
jgi:hypothetical protein